MPIYTYRCESCGETFDKRQSFSDAALTTHETCGGELRKVLHPAGIVFKGSGFYNTDYKTGSAGSAKTDDGTPSETAAAPSNGATESKSESTTAPAASTTADSSGSGSATPAAPSAHTSSAPTFRSPGCRCSTPGRPRSPPATS